MSKKLQTLKSSQNFVIMKNLSESTKGNSANTLLATVTFGQLFKSWLAKFACHHSWYKYHECDVYNYSGRSRIGFQHTLICEKCGKIQKLKL